LSILNNFLKSYKTEKRFILVGAWNTFFGYGLFFLLDTVFNNYLGKERIVYMLAISLAQFFAIINAFIFHKFITFKTQTKGMDLVKEFIKFFSSYLFIFILNLVLLPLFVEIFGLVPKLAALFLIPISMVVSFIMLSQVAFKENKHIS
tara:strand:- start:1535 stop:1978 length:444 start_codon:yes stop_codon:yes gene_type:complete